MPIHDSAGLRDLLTSARVIAVVGMSDRTDRPSNQIGRLLPQWGYRIYPVNPDIAGKEIDGMKVLPSLDAVPEHIDIVNVFRRAQFIPEVVEDAIKVGAEAVWVQLGIVNDAAAQRAEEAGLKYVQDRCIKIDYFRLIK
jgi:predicted CoA-binding protein